MEPRKHCDEYIDDPSQPDCLRAFLDYARSPAHGDTRGYKPTLFADYRGTRVRVVMASRFGNVGVTTDLDAVYGYQRRVGVDELSNFSA
jgi:hypothetical protein